MSRGHKVAKNRVNYFDAYLKSKAINGVSVTFPQREISPVENLTLAPFKYTKTAT